MVNVMTLLVSAPPIDCSGSGVAIAIQTIPSMKRRYQKYARMRAFPRKLCISSQSPCWRSRSSMLGMNGHMPAILATGAPVRDKLFNENGTVVSQHSIFAGCVLHLEMFMRKDHLLRNCPDIKKQHEYSQQLAVFYSQQFYTTSQCTFVEDWSGLGNLSEAELKAFEKEHAKLMRELRKRGGITTGQLGTLASALSKVDCGTLKNSIQRCNWCLFSV